MTASADTTPPRPTDVVAFWCEAGPERWFKKDASFDAEIRARFLALYEAAAAHRLDAWETSAQGALALLLVLDQFPRNMFRDDARAFAADPQARTVAERAIARGHDRAVEPSLRTFFYLPFEHSEDIADQERCIRLFRAMADAELLKWAQLHADIIHRFGRFPQRNDLLGRQSTPQELAFLAAGGFKG
ncbi:MAG: DUF924 domain-containing protein [Proteobacteria bacterium]|nr:DUF924 domain-containing protein [Pseudomonadota bacterium]